MPELKADLEAAKRRPQRRSMDAGKLEALTPSIATQITQEMETLRNQGAQPREMLEKLPEALQRHAEQIPSKKVEKDDDVWKEVRKLRESLKR